MYRFQNKELGTDERVKALLEELALEEKLTLLTTRQRAVPRLGLREFVIGTEVARGLVCRGSFGDEVSTVFPEPFGLAATFDEELMRSIGEVTGIETRIYHKKGKASLCVWGPTVDAERDPRWGRTEEGYGEDPFLIGKMSTEYTKGMIGCNERYTRLIPTLKHFYANNNEENRGSDNASIPLCLKHDYYLKSFEYAIKSGGAKSLMTAYNCINGVEGLCNPEVGELCEKEWGMLFAVTDGGDFVQNVQYHRSDPNHTEAIARIYKSHGAEIMTDDSEIVSAAAREALERGLISEEDIDRALFGVLKARFMLGEIDNAEDVFDYPDDMVCCAEHYAVTERAAEESVILLRNSRGILPFSKKEKLAVVGVHADMNFRDWYTGTSDKNSTILDAITAAVGRENVVYDSGNDVIALRNAADGFYFSVDEEGTLRADCAIINERCLLELYEWGDGAVSLRSKMNGKLMCDAGIIKCTSDEPYGWFVKEKFTLERNGRDCILRNWQERFLYVTEKGELAVTTDLKPKKSSVFNMEVFSSGAERVRRVVTDAHQTVVFCGNNPMINAREGCDRKHLRMPEKQIELLDTALTFNENTALFLVSGYPYALDDGRRADDVCLMHDDRLTAVLHITHAGPALGTAVTKTLFGDISPAGRCPMTWYDSERELCGIKDYNIIRTRSTYLYYDGTPLFSFGHGLSYTVFRYGALKVNKSSFAAGDTVEVTLDVANAGMRDSAEVVQLYAAAPRFSGGVPRKRLCAFKRVFIPHGERLSVTLNFDANELSMWDINTSLQVLFSGAYELQAGASCEDIRQTAEIMINGAEYEGIDVSKAVPAAASFDYRGVTFEADRQQREYALIKDWQSFLRYENCKLSGGRRAEIEISNPGSATRLMIVRGDTGAAVAEFDVPATNSYTEFVKLTADAEPLSGTFDLKITSGGVVGLRYFRISS